MPDDRERIIAFFGQLASVVVHAVKGGTDDDRKRLVHSLGEMKAGLPVVSEDTANARAFLDALISLLSGEPVSPEGLVEPYMGIYARIVESVFTPQSPRRQNVGNGHDRSNGHGHAAVGGLDEEGDIAMKEFLTQIAASVVLVMKNGSEDDINGLADKLGGLMASIPEEEKGPRSLVSAFISLLKGSPVSPDTLSRPFSSIYRKVMDESAKGRGKTS